MADFPPTGSEPRPPGRTGLRPTAHPSPPVDSRGREGERLRTTSGSRGPSMKTQSLRNSHRSIGPGLIVALFTTIACQPTTALADVKLPAIFGSHMVLQRDQKDRVWGW